MWSKSCLVQPTGHCLIMQPSLSVVRGHGWALTRIPCSPERPGHSSAAGPLWTHSWEMWCGGPGIPKVQAISDGHTWATWLRVSQGPACLPRDSVSFWSPFLCTMAGYVIVSLLLCSFRTIDRPVLDMKTVVVKERKCVAGHLLTAVSDWPEVSHLKKGKGKSPNTHLQWGHRLAVICVFQK